MGSAASQIIPTIRVNNKTYYQGADGQYYDGLGAPMEDSAPQNQDSSAYLQNVTSTDPQGDTYAYNPLQYATQDTAQKLGTELNLPVTSTQLQYFDQTSPQYQVGGENAGLVQDTIDRYGQPTPGSYSAYLISRDLASDAGQSYVDPYATGGPQQVGSSTNVAALPGTYTSQYGTTGKQLTSQMPGTVSPSSANSPGSIPTITGVTRPTPPTTLPTSGVPTTTNGNGGGRSNSVVPSGSGSSSTATGGTTSGGTQNTNQTTKTGTGTSNQTATSGINLTGLQVTKSAYNNAYEGTVTINGVSQRIAVLPDGRVFNSSGQDITSQVSSNDLNSLRSAFSTAANDPAYKPGSATQSNTGTGQSNTSSGSGQSSRQPIDSGYHAPAAATAPPITAPANTIAPNASYGSDSPIASFVTATNPYANVNGGAINPVYNTTGKDVDIQAQNDRNLAQEKGEQLGQNLGNYTDQQYAAAGDFQNQLNSAWAPIANGQGGYSQAQEQAILQQPLLDSLQQTSDEAQQSYLTPEEQAGITGDTGAAYAQLGKDEAGVNTAQNTRDAAVRGSVDAEQDNVFGALDSTAGAVRDAYGNAATNVNGALGSGATATRSYLDPTALNVSQDYLNNEQFGAQDEQDLEDQAGRTVGNQNAAAEDQLQQQAFAGGNTSPLALEAARNRLAQTGQINSADAMTDARIQAKQLALQTTQNRENTRLGAAQNYANLGTNTEENLGQQNVSAQENLGAAEQGAEQYLGTQAQQAQQAVGSARTGAEESIGQSNIDTSTDLAKTNLAAGQAEDAANSQRATELATNRQAASQYNQNQRYTRGTAEYNDESAANTNFANTQLNQEGQYRTYLQGQQSQAAQGTQVGNQQQVGNYSTQSGAVNSATSNSVNNAKTPDESSVGSVLSKVFGLAKGGVTPGPHTAIVGEKGPELIINLPKFRQDEYGEYPRYGDGGIADGPFPGSDIPQADDSYTAPVSAQAQQLGYEPAKPKINPFVSQILAQRFGVPDPNNPYAQPGGQAQGGGIGKQVVGGLIGKGLGALGLAHGGVVTGGAEREPIAPGIDYVNGPQLAALGTYGADAVVPLQQRKSNNINLQDIPRLVAEYGDYGRGEPAANTEATPQYADYASYTSPVPRANYADALQLSTPGSLWSSYGAPTALPIQKMSGNRFNVATLPRPAVPPYGDYRRESYIQR